MRFELLIGGVAATGLALVLAACGEDDTVIGATPEDDAGASSSGGSSGTTSSSSGSTSSSSSSSSSSSGSTSSGGLKPVELKAGTAVLVGIAGDQVVYFESDAVHAVPIAGGASTKIADIGQTDDFALSGGAVAVYSGIANGQGALKVWTKANGLKDAVASNSAVGVFVASADGSRVAFSAGATPPAATPTSTPIRVASAADPATAIATLSGLTVSMNLAAASGQNPSCPPDISFVGQKLLAAYCTGTTAAATQARLFLVDGATIDRLDANVGAGAIQPFWVADATASKVFVIGLPGGGTPNQGRWINVADGVITPIEASVDSGVLLQDGSAVVYRTEGNALKKATTAAPPVVTTVVGTDVLGVLGVSPDQKKFLYRTLPPASGLVDIRLVDHTAGSPTPVDIVATAAAIPVGFNAPGSHVAYLADLAQTGAKLKAKPAAGGAEKELAPDVFGALLPTQGTSTVLLTNRKQVMVGQQQATFFDLKNVDSVAGGAPVTIATDVPRGLYAFKDKTLVYTRLVQAGAGSGLYAVTLP